MSSRWSNLARRLQAVRIDIRAAIALLFLCAAISGCGQSGATSTAASNGVATPAKDAEQGIKPDEIFRRTAKAYQEAKSYSDEGELVVQFPGAGEPSRFPFSVVFERQGSKIRISAYQVTLASDGKRMRGFVEDTLSNNLDSQFLDAPAPKRLAPENVISDPETASILSQGAGGPPPVLEWLLAKSPFGEVLATPERLKKLTSRELDGHNYYRVEIDLLKEPSDTSVEKSPIARKEHTQIVLWIDQKTWLVRRLEYPPIDSPEATGGAEKNQITITAEFRKVQANGEVDASQFVLKPTKDAKVVGFFVAPPPPIPRERLGKEVTKFEIENLDGGGKLTSDEMKGKTQVLLFVRNHPGCEEAARQVQHVYSALSSDPRFLFRVVANEPREVSNSNISAMFERWGVTIPAAREAGETTGGALAIESLPTLIILDAKGQMQFTQSFGFASLAATLPALCEQIASGEQIYKRLLDVQKQYEERLELAKSGGKPTSIVLKPTQIAPARPPRQLKMGTAWDNAEFKNASCILATKISGEDRILVLEAPRTVHLISNQGKSIGKKELSLPVGAEIKVIRSATDSKNQTYFVGFTPGGIAAYFFDEKLESIGSFPAEDQAHEGVADAIVSDLDGKGTVEGYVGFSAFLGVQAIQLDGERIWRNLAIPSVISLAAGPKNVAGWRKLFATDDRGRVILLNQFGNHEVVELEDREIHRLFGRNDATAEMAAEGDAIYCGISFQEKDKLLAIGFDSEFGEAWTYELPPGVFVGPVQYTSSLAIPNSKDVVWTIAAPDGSIHFVGSRGQFEDSTGIGERVVGVTAIEVDQIPTLVYATESGIHARSLELPKADSAAK